LPAIGITPGGVVVQVVGRDGAAVKVKTPCERAATVPSVKAVGPVDVVLDPGHGGHETGAVGPNGLTEAVLNLAVTDDAKAALEASGVRVAMTRTGDYMETLSTRAAIVTTLKPKAFVSIHHNADPDGPFATPGTETYYQYTSAASKRLAGLIYEEVHTALARYDVAWVADTDAGAKYRLGSSGTDYYAVLRQTKGVTSALAELAYISDPAEEALLARPDVQQVEGQAVARGIVRFLTTKDPGSGFTTPYPRTTPAGGGGGTGGCVDPPLV
jgi:N-acetylmuramoyl-L-alanine amidase